MPLDTSRFSRRSFLGAGAAGAAAVAVAAVAKKGRNKVVYFGDDDSGIAYAADAQTGAVHWTWNVPEDYETIGAPVAVGPDGVYVIDESCTLYALSTSGRLLASAQVVDSGYDWWGPPALPIDGQVVVTDPVGRVDAFTARGLRRIGHAYTTGNEITTAPIANRNSIFFGDPNGYVTALNPATLERKWEWTTPQAPGTPQVSDGVVVTPCGGQLVALRESDGKHLWSHGGVELGTPCIYNGVIYAYGGSDLHAIELHSGKTLWQRQVWEAGSGHYLHPFARAGIVCSYVNCTVTAESGWADLAAFSARTGRRLWTNATVAPTSAPVIANGLMYMGGQAIKESFNHAFYCIEAATGKVRWRIWLQGDSAYGPTVTTTNVGSVSAIPY
jgi:outer membrane protein assembly factor BamB